MSKTKSSAERGPDGKKKHRKRTRYGRWLKVSATAGNAAGGRFGDNNVVKLGIYMWAALFVLLASVAVIAGGSISLHYCSEAAAVNLSVLSGIVLFIVAIMSVYQAALLYSKLNNMLSSMWITPAVGFVVSVVSAVMSMHAMHCEEIAKSGAFAQSSACAALKSKLCKSTDARRVTTLDDSLSFWGSTCAAAFCLVAMAVGRMVEKIELERRREAADVKMEIGEAEFEELTKTAGTSEEKSRTKSAPLQAAEKSQQTQETKSRSENKAKKPRSKRNSKNKNAEPLK